MSSRKYRVALSKHSSQHWHVHLVCASMPCSWPAAFSRVHRADTSDHFWKVRCHSHARDSTTFIWFQFFWFRYFCYKMEKSKWNWRGGWPLPQVNGLTWGETYVVGTSRSVGLFSPVIVYTVTSIGDWVVGLLLSLIDSVQDFCLPASTYHYVLTCKPASCPIVAWHLVHHWFWGRAIKNTLLWRRMTPHIKKSIWIKTPLLFFSLCPMLRVSPFRSL